MEIILLHDVDSLGEAGDIIRVKPGYARNKLIPEGLALRASKKNRAISDERKKVIKSRLKRESAAFESQVNKLNKAEITIEVQVGDDEKMFGAVTSMDIHKMLEEKGVKVDRHDILLEEPIKALGIYRVPVKVTPQLNGEIKVYVITI